ncbi:MAG: exodeoxyribonuclease VII large subunit [Candidatus Zhuqueibacterota bacterium]
MPEFESELAPHHIFSVSGLTTEIKLLLETTVPIVWLEGEISNLTFHSSGHLYFSLKDRDSQMSAVMWRSRNASLFFTPQDGMKVLALGRVTVYQKRGVYQFDVIKLQPAGVGELQLAFEQLKQKLMAEGLFDSEKKKPLPPFPERIGIVTSPTGAAIQDLLTILNRRMPGMEIILTPVKVQGEGAAEEIAAAIDRFNEFGQVDLLIVGRGGGSLEDLWAFNEETVARAISRSRIPVISAVGHEVDFSISDFVADLRAPTPSAAAELAAPDREELSARIRMYQKQLVELSLGRIQFERDRLDGLMKSYSFRRMPDLVRQKQQRVDELQHALHVTTRHRLTLLSHRLDGLVRRLSALAPDAILKRGYSICYRTEDGRIITDVSWVQPRDKITVQVHRGKMNAEIESIDNCELTDDNW